MTAEWSWTPGERPMVRPLDDTKKVYSELHRAFYDDRELLEAACIFAEARNLCMGGALPRPVRRQLAPIVADLNKVLHGGRRLVARRVTR